MKEAKLARRPAEVDPRAAQWLAERAAEQLSRVGGRSARLVEEAKARAEAEAEARRRSESLRNARPAAEPRTNTAAVLKVATLARWQSSRFPFV